MPHLPFSFPFSHPFPLSQPSPQKIAARANITNIASWHQFTCNIECGADVPGTNCRCSGGMNSTFDAACATDFPHGGQACVLDLKAGDDSWTVTNAIWLCYPRGCSSNDLDQITEYFRNLNTPIKADQIIISTERCDKVGSWIGPVWLAGALVPLALWGSLYVYYSRTRGTTQGFVSSGNTGFTTLSTPDSSGFTQLAQPLAPNVASPDWAQQQQMQTGGGAASL
jgi:hypothetical protein